MAASEFCFKNRNLINGQVNWFIKINVNVEVFFIFITTVGVTDQFWLISRVTDWFWLISFDELQLPYPSLPNATQPDYGIINLIYVFLRFPLFGFYSGENIYSFLILVV